MSSITDFSVIICRTCGESKTRYAAGKYGNGKDRRWVDDKGLQFNGLQCSLCNRKRVAEAKSKRKSNV